LEIEEEQMNREGKLPEAGERLENHLQSFL
jgi:hypothetical protein